MSEQEKLREYIREQSVPKTASSKPAPVKKSIRAKSVASVFLRDAFRKLIMLIILVPMFSFVVVFILYTMKALTDEMFIIWPVTVALIILGFMVFQVMRWIAYTRWVAQKFYPVAGWQEFIERRSAEFWKGEMYTNVEVKIGLRENATPLHRQAAEAFMQRWSHDWRKMYDRTWQSGSGKPDVFKANNCAIKGDLSQSELGKLINMMTTKLPVLAKLLGENLVEVEIKSVTKEHRHKVMRVRSDAHDRNSAREASRSLRD